MASEKMSSSRWYFVVMESACPDLLKVKLSASIPLRRSWILFWSEVEERGFSQLNWRTEYLGELGALTMLGTVSSELGIKEALVS